MMDLISRQDVIDAVIKYCTKYDLRELLADIEVLPSVEQAQATLDDVSNAYENGYQQGKFEATQKTGKWLEKNCVCSEESHLEDWQSCCCSVCKHYDTRPYMYYFDEPNYCSYCGARMEKKS